MRLCASPAHAVAHPPHTSACAPRTTRHTRTPALVPAGTLSPDGSALRMGADMGLALAIPLHSHVAMNYVLTDYVPRGMQGACSC